MNKAILIGLLIALSPSAFAEISLTEEQYANMDIIHDELKNKDSKFKGLSGTQGKMEVIGISEKEALKVIAKIDFKKAREDKDTADPVKSARKTGIEKLKTVVGLTIEELKALGIGHGQ